MVNSEYIIHGKTTLMEALEIMDKRDRKLLLICDQDKFLGLISIGDIQRAILAKKDLSFPALNYMRSNITIATVDDDPEQIKKRMRVERIESMPVIDHKNRLVDVIEWSELLEEADAGEERIDYPVVIMAGGKGTRLLPLTNIIPKPLIPISDKTIIEEIMTSFRDAGCRNFWISVNYKKEAIEGYFAGRKEWKIEFIHEEKPLGTAGSLYLLKDRLKGTFFVINCDTLVKVKLPDLVKYHHDSGNVITVVSVVKKMSIPYGTLETDVGGIVREIREKPEYVYQINSGMYILETEALGYLKDNTFTNISDLIDLLIRDGKRVGAFPVPENSWVDMGSWNEYLKVMNKYSFNMNE